HAATRIKQLVLIDVARCQPRDEQIPDADARMLAHGMEAPVPGIELADDADAAGVGRPHGKAHAVYTVDARRMCAESIVSAQVRALAQEIDIKITQRAAERIGVGRFPGVRAAPLS